MKFLLPAFLLLPAFAALAATGDIIGLSIRRADGGSTAVPLTSTSSSVLQINSSGTLTTGTVTNAMLAGSIDLTSKVTGTLPVANGGTGITALGTGVATALAQAVTGSGSIVLATSPTITTPTISGAIAFPDGTRQIFNPDGTNAGLNVGSHAGDPSAPSNGDLWYDSGSNELTARINGANVALGAGGGGGVSIGTAGSDNGVNTGGALGTIDLSGGDASASNNGGAGGYVSMIGGDASGIYYGGAAGTIKTDGGTSAGAANGGLGGNLWTFGHAGGNAGGSLYIYGNSSGAGGSITTYGGGGSLNTRGTGSLELGANGTRTTLTGSASTNRSIALPNVSGTVITTGDSGTVTNAMLAGSIDLTSKVTGTLPVANGGTGITVLGTGVAPALGNAVDAASGLLTYGIIGSSGTKLGLLNTANTWSAAQTVTPSTPGACLTLTSGTVTASLPALSMTQTWNNAGTTFLASSIAVTKTASAAASSYLSILGGASGTTNRYRFTEDTYGPHFKIGEGTNSYYNIYVLEGYRVQIDSGLLTGSVFHSINSTRVFGYASDNALGVAVNSSLRLGFSSDANCTDLDAFFKRKTTATIQMGADVNGSPVPQGFQAHNGITGTNIAGANLSLGGGLSTGTGRGGDLIGKTAHSSTSGTTANSYTTRQYHSAKWVDLTETTATTFANIAVASGKYSGAVLVCTVNASDGTDHQCLTSTVNLNAINKAGTVTATITQVDGTTAASTGTLTVTFTAVASGNTVDLKADATSSLTQTQLRIKWAIISLNTDSTDTSLTSGSTVTPQ